MPARSDCRPRSGLRRSIFRPGCGRSSRVILVSQELNSPEVDERRGTRNIISYVVGLTDIARAARYHHLLDDHGHPVIGTIRSQAFASTTYLEALFRGRDLANDETQGIASRLNSFTGIPRSWFLDTEVAITRGEFALEALKTKGKRLSTYDDRIVGRMNGADPFEMSVEKRFVESALADLRRISPRVARRLSGKLGCHLK